MEAIKRCNNALAKLAKKQFKFRRIKTGSIRKTILDHKRLKSNVILNYWSIKIIIIKIKLIYWSFILNFWMTIKKAFLINFIYCSLSRNKKWSDLNIFFKVVLKKLKLGEAIFSDFFFFSIVWCTSTALAVFQPWSPSLEC